MVDALTAPWTEEQVNTLNAYQAAGLMHPYTCGTCRDAGKPGESKLVATTEGWYCPREQVIVQTWCHEQTAQPEFLNALRFTVGRFRDE